jgi:MOSC domain-containing protein YiiM
VARIWSVNLGRGGLGAAGLSGIDKRPVDGPVEVRAPAGPGLSGLSGDTIASARHHGGDAQAVYAYAREDLDAWSAELGRPLPPGSFGDNLTTAGVDVTGAVIGSRWQVGAVRLQVTLPRIPCRTFATWMGEPDWIRRFAARGAPGTYLRVLAPGELAAGDPVAVVHRPDHGVTIGEAFRALMTEPALLPRVLTAGDDLPGKLHDRLLRRLRPAG